MGKKISRRAVCAGLVATPVAAALAPLPATSTPADIETAANAPPPVDIIGRVIATVAADAGITVDDLLSPLRTREVVAARQKGLYLATCMTRRPLPEVGRRFGGRDHTTVLHAVRKIAGLADADPTFRDDLNRLARLVTRNGAAMVFLREHDLRSRGIIKRSFQPAPGLAIRSAKV